MSQIQRNLANLIKAGGTNPTALSKETGVPQPTIHRILDGTSRDPRTSTLRPLAAHFNVTVEALRTKDLATGEDLFSPPIIRERPTAKTFKEPLENSNSVAAKAKEGGKNIPSIHQQMEQQFAEALPEDLREHLEYGTFIQGNRYIFDYCSEKIVAEIGTVYFRGLAGDVSRLSLNLTRALWRLSTFRLLTQESHPDRGYYLFAALINDSGHPMPVAAISRLMGEGTLHNVRMVLSSPGDAANFVENIERGTLSNSDFDSHFDEPDEES